MATTEGARVSRRGSLRPGRIGKDGLLPCAAKTLAEMGFGGITLHRVAACAGVSTGTVNYYFKNKALLLAETTVYASERLHARVLQGIAAETDSTMQLKALVRGTVPTSDESVADSRIFMACWSEAIRSPEIQAVYRKGMAEWDQILQGIMSRWIGNRDVSDDRRRACAVALNAFLDGIVVQRLVGYGVELDTMEVEDVAVALVAMTLGPSTSKRST